MFEPLLRLVDKFVDCLDAFGLIEGKMTSPQPLATIVPQLPPHEMNRFPRVEDASTANSKEITEI